MSAAEEMVFQKGDKWICQEPGWTTFDGNTGKVIETVPPQDFEYPDQAQALGHAEWFPPPPC